jgi:aspartyl-tRNA(Asn)/glutamyl-tRNA(Gln) amidotransferase subunit C
MDISELEVTASLAHVGFSHDELEAAFPAFRQMLGYFEAMRAADTDDAAFDGPLASLAPQRPIVQSPHFRADAVATATATAEVTASGDALLQNPGETDGRFVVIPNVL